MSASRLFDYERSMPLQQNAQRPDTEQSANSSLACLAWFSSMAGSSVCCLPTCTEAEPRPGAGGQGSTPVRPGSTTPAGGVTAKHTNSYCNSITVRSLHLHPLLRFKLQPIHGTQILSRGVCVSFLCSVVLMVRAMKPEQTNGRGALRTVCTAVNSASCRSADCC